MLHFLLSSSEITSGCFLLVGELRLAVSLPWPCQQLCWFLVRVDSPWSLSSCCCDWCLFCEPEQAAAVPAPVRPALCAQTERDGGQKGTCFAAPGDGQPFTPSQHHAVAAISLLSPQQCTVMAGGVGASPRLRRAVVRCLLPGQRSLWSTACCSSSQPYRGQSCFHRSRGKAGKTAGRQAGCYS